MTVAAERKVWSDEEFMALPKDGHRYEVVDGELIDMGNSGMEHGNLGSYLGGLLELYARPKRLGVTCDSSTAFKLTSGNRRSPDVSFVVPERLQVLGSGRLPTGYFEGAPDLAVEILSDGNTVEETHTKIVEYFENGARLVWVIHPDERYVLVYDEPSPDQFLKVGDSLDGEDVVPGFSCPVADLFIEWEL
ncbi:MAG: Uma2 family endonuclease [Cyanobacteria bacterium J06626_14]